MSLDEKLDITTKTFHLELLHILKDSQQQHGLRHGDFQRYRQYISRKLRRVRKSLHFLQGNRSRVVHKEITKEMLTDVRYIYLKLFETERCWAYAMQLKTESNTETRKRFHMVSRLRKAVRLSEELAELCQADVCDARTKLEIQAYSRWMQGSLHFETHNWSKAKEMLEAARSIYSGLSDAVAEDQKAVYTSRADELLPQVRYCAYNMGEECAVDDLRAMRAHAGAGSSMSGDVVQLDSLLEQTRASQAQTVTEVSWLDHVIPVRQEKARLVVLAVEDLTTELSTMKDTDGKMALYDTVLKSCVEAIAAVKDEMRADPSQKPVQQSSGAQQSLDKMTRLQLLHTYLQFVKLVKTAERNLILIASGSSGNKPQELARLYDTVMQTVQEIAGLPGVSEDHLVQEDMQARISVLRAYRCYYLAQSYLQGKKFAEATALLRRSGRHSSMAVQALDTLPASAARTPVVITGSGSSAQLLTEMQEMGRRAEAEELSCRASQLLDMIKDSKHSDSHEDTKHLAKKTLSDRLDVYYEDSALLGKSANLVQSPPAFEPVPVKPFFFDLALNHVEFPSLDDKLDDSKKRGAAGGLTGMVRGWLWGGGKK